METTDDTPLGPAPTGPSKHVRRIRGGGMESPRGPDAQHPHDLFTTASLPRPNLAGVQNQSTDMQTDQEVVT